MEVTYDNATAAISGYDNASGCQISITPAPLPAPVAALHAAQSQALAQSTSTPNSNTRKRGGAPSGNSNAATHGMKGSSFPPGAIREQATVRAIVNAAKAACEAKHGHPVTVHQMALLHRLRRAATKDRLAARWLRLESDKLTVEQRLSLVDAMEASAATIEKCLKSLGLDSLPDAADPWSALQRPALNATGASGRFSAPSSVFGSTDPAKVPPCFSEKRTSDLVTVPAPAPITTPAE